jgi:hypothetical protein
MTLPDGFIPVAISRWDSWAFKVQRLPGLDDEV